MSEKYVIFHIEGGAGKSVLATAVCASIKAAYPEHKLVVISPWPEIFLHNPVIYRIYRTGNFAYFYEDFIKNKDSIILRLDPYHSSEFIHQNKSIIEVWCNLYNIPCVNLQPRIFLTQRELIHCTNTLNKKGPMLLIQSSGGAEDPNNLYSWARDLPPGFTQNLVDKVYQNYDKVLHVRKEKQLTLNNTTTLTDSLRNLFCYVFLADKILAIDSMVQHIAAALDKPAVVGWIANSPVVFGHAIHKNVLPVQDKVFRHQVDCYFEEYDWTGHRHYECPYDDIENIFKEQDFLDYLTL